jgi:acetolactate synthase-1/2/3 large subunit
MNGAEHICAILKRFGVEVVFGLPGTQNITIYDAMRGSGLRSVVASDEGAAAFMASGYARATGRVGVLTTIPGPGFVYALSGVMEARHDSVPLLWLTLRQKDDGQAFPLQRIDQPAMAGPAVKRCFYIEHAVDLAMGLSAAFAETTSGEPGPVLVEIAMPMLVQDFTLDANAPAMPVAVSEDLDRLRSLFMAAQRPVIYAGQGAQAAAADVWRLAHLWCAPVLFTSSGRGVLPDADPLAFVKDFSFGVGAVVPYLIARADLVLALGCKFSHNGSAAGRLQLPPEKLVRIDSSASVLAANYPAALALASRVESVLPGVIAMTPPRSQWTDDELQSLRARLQAERESAIEHEPVLVDCNRAPARSLFLAMAGAFGPDVVYTTDAGLHQALVRRYADVTQPRGLLCPSDFQSMGFGLPGAIGAALARPGTTVVACVGDGALILTLGELLTAVREGVDLAVVVFNDASYGLIRRQQLLNFGKSSGVELHNPDYAALASAVGCSYFAMQGDPAATMKSVMQTPGVRLVEVRLDDASSLARQGLKSVVREKMRRILPDTAWQLLKRALRS